MTGYNNYLSPFSWRYGSSEMRKTWGEVNKRKLWRYIWVSLAEVQLEFGLTNSEQVDDLRAHQFDVNMTRAQEIESQIHHDLMAEIKTYEEQCSIGGGIIHLGATSVDIKDNATVLQMKAALEMIKNELEILLLAFVEKVDLYAQTPIIAFTHLQPAEPSTLGYRFAQYAQDLFMDWTNLINLMELLRGKGFTGAVGTSASYAELIGIENLKKFQNLLGAKLSLDFFPVTTQTYPRKQDFQILSSLASIGSSINKFAIDLRFLQSPSLGELAEQFQSSQVGSSAMPFKRNPISSEKMNSLARMLAQFPRTAWDNAANSFLERTLDDSANRRSIIPETFLITDELLRVAIKVLKNMEIHETAMDSNLKIYGPFAAIERLLMALCKTGANRQTMHERLRKHALVSLDAIQHQKNNPLQNLLLADKEIMSLLSEPDLLRLMDYQGYIGDAPQRAQEFAAKVKERLQL